MAGEIARLGVPPEAVIIDLPGGALSEADPLAGCLIQERPPAETGDGDVALTLSKETVAPGEVITLDVSGADVTKGVASYVECWDGTSWTPRYLMLTARNDQKPITVLYDPDGAVEGLAVLGPERVKIPEGLQPGWYRIRKDVSILEGDRNVSRSLHSLIEVTAP